MKLSLKSIIVVAILYLIGIILPVTAVAVEEPVVFPDTNLKTVIYDVIGKSDPEPIYPSDLTPLTTLEANLSGISNIEGLEYCTNLTELNLSVNHIIDISPLQNLTNLTKLQLHANQISNISPINGLQNLTTLYLNENQIIDVSPLESLTSLVTLYLYDNQISVISPLENLTSLQRLYLHGNLISDISPLHNVVNLQNLRLQDNQIINISALQYLESITHLLLNNNQISDIEALVNNPGISGYVNLSDNPLGATSMEVYIPELIARGIVVDYTTSGLPVAKASALLYIEQVGSDFSFDGSASYDPDGVLVSYDWSFGDTHNGSGISASHAYDTVGIYEVVLTVTDDDGAQASDSIIVVVYDPDGGFATGGGQFIPGSITSEAGDDLPSLDGSSPAKFGFVVKHQNGATTPSGQLQFNYRQGDFNLHSDGIDWMVIVNNNWAKFQGTATIHGIEGFFQFRVNSRDGDFGGGDDTDRFIIKVYAPGSDPEEVDPIYKASGDVIRGNVVIHSN